ncbi:Na+/Ca+ antiporter, CaCA family [Halothece sp. PCC 7418]|uniref:calcium/sodium antiporter n=1 Tax=Halothece sp. (strain PCC 7418) TaxID=65093 RepID=UPI0002A08577|nr:calcium/sodium antiporter [Halothece sp. PCC 7418]AFZ44476.1 Na+/Ca+ antiporter, CaCA family [Halothece sp. PCC 7418]
MTIIIIKFIIGLALLVKGADYLVQGAGKLATLAGISPLVVGLTVVAFGTSSPELAVSLKANFTQQAAISVGNVIGSNITNILLILGIAATITPLSVSQKLVRMDVPIMIGISILLLFFSLDRQIGKLDGFLLLLGGILYTTYLLIQSRRNHSSPEELTEEFDVIPQEKSLREWLINIGLFIIGFVMVVWGSDWLVFGATTIAESFGVSELVIGLTVVALGTSLPELATSITASLKGETDIAVGNVVGSNIFNILIVLGTAGIFAPSGVEVSAAAINLDIPIMIAVAIACLPVFFTDNLISRWEGIFFWLYYIVYTLFLFLKSTEQDTLPIFNAVMLWFVIPITAVTLIIITISHWRDRAKFASKVHHDQQLNQSEGDQ